MERSQELRAFVHTAKATLAGVDGDIGDTAGKVFTALDAGDPSSPTHSSGDDASPPTYPVLAHLEPALANATNASTQHGRDLGPLRAAIAALAPALRWARKAVEPADPHFQRGHANCQIIGPEGIEQRTDVRIGMSLLAPNVRYPDHSHPPEEIYIVLSDGEWYRPDAGWYRPGIGGLVHHPPGIVHAMRSGPRPLLAVWLLPG